MTECNPSPFSTVIEGTDVESLRDRYRYGFMYMTPILKSICGPNARNIAIPTMDAMQSTYTIFSKDGRQTIANTHMVDVVHEHARDLLYYVGSRVDAVAKDGTTSSMLLTALLAEQLLQYTPEDAVKITQRVITSFEQLVVEATSTVESLEALMSSVDGAAMTTQQLRRRLAYVQAMTSSRNDAELSQAVMTILGSVPEELYDYQAHSFRQRDRESDEHFTVLTQSSDIRMQAINVVDGTNDVLGVSYDGKRPLVIATSDDLAKGTQLTALLIDVVRNLSAFIKKDLEERPDDTRWETDSEFDLTRDVVIVAPSPDRELIAVINEFNTIPRRSPYRIRLYALESASLVASRYPDALRAMADLPPLGDQVLHIRQQMKHAKSTDELLQLLAISAEQVTFVDHTLHVYGVVTYDSDDQVLHPYYDTPDDAHPHFHAFITMLRQQISSTGTRTTHRDEGLTVAWAELYHQMVARHKHTLLIGGTAHDNMANKIVVEDAFGAAISALRHGVVFGTIMQLAMMLSRKLEQYRADENPTHVYAEAPAHGFFEWFFRNPTYPCEVTITPDEEADHILYQALLEMLSAMAGSSPLEHDALGDRVVEFFTRQRQYDTVKNGVSPFLSRDADGDLIPVLTDIASALMATEGGQYDGMLIAQPAIGYMELAKRLREILPKLVNTEYMMQQSTVYRG